MEQEKQKKGIAIVLFIGCATLGAATGWLYDRPDIGGAFGAGIGFLVVAALWMYYRNK